MSDTTPRCQLLCTTGAREPTGIVQVTVTGDTPAQAVLLLRQTVHTLREETIPAPALEPPIPTLEHLLASAIGQALAMHDETLALRLTHAAILVHRDAVRPTDTPGCYTVDSETNSVRAYAVTQGICACPDDRYPACTHALAVQLFEALAEAY